MSLAGAALFCASYFLPWWRLWLFAPQYPKGLEVGISLTGVGGDVRELNILNHYIGMKPLDLAAL
ncbi:MAG: cytochrome C, partial [Polyangiales bacterium]